MFTFRSFVLLSGSTALAYFVRSFTVGGLRARVLVVRFFYVWFQECLPLYPFRVMSDYHG